MKHGVLISPSEPQELKDLLDAVTSPLCELNGADVMGFITVRNNLYVVGWQRKTVSDLLSSISDGRLARELLFLSKLDKSILILEGVVEYTKKGQVRRSNGKPMRYTRKQLRNILRSANDVLNIKIEYTDSIEDTANAIFEYGDYLEKQQHLSLFRRPTPRYEWYTPSFDEQRLFFMQGFFGIGPVLAQNIITHFNGVPMRWNCSLKDLMRVPGIGKIKAKRIYEFLQRVEEESEKIND